MIKAIRRFVRKFKRDFLNNDKEYKTDKAKGKRDYNICYMCASRDTTWMCVPCDDKGYVTKEEYEEFKRTRYDY